MSHKGYEVLFMYEHVYLYDKKTSEDVALRTERLSMIYVNIKPLNSLDPFITNYPLDIDVAQYGHIFEGST